MALETANAAAITAAKARLRDEAKARREALSEDDRRSGSAAIAAHGLAFLGATWQRRVVSGFIAIGAEIDPAALLARLQGDGATTALPVMIGKGKALEFRAWKTGDALASRMWGIREPTEDARVVVPDIVLVPLLAFDRRGHRLGYGGGFYDRTLAGLRRRAGSIAVGLAFAMQEVDAVPHLDYDERLDWVLTPEGPISTRP